MPCHLISCFISCCFNLCMRPTSPWYLCPPVTASLFWASLFSWISNQLKMRVNSLLGVNCLQSLMMTAFVVFHEKSHLLSTKARVQDRDSRFNRHFLSNSLQYWCTLCDCSADNLTELVFFTMTVWECVGVLSVFNPYSRKNAIDSWTLSCITWRNWIWE